MMNWHRHWELAKSAIRSRRKLRGGRSRVCGEALESRIALTAVIVDNGDFEFSTLGAWSAATGQGHQDDVHFAESGSGSVRAAWAFDVVPGLYRVSATWSEHPNRATDAPYTITDGSTDLVTIDVDQVQAPATFFDQGSHWEDLGDPIRITSTSLFVELGNDANGFVIADAVRVEKLLDAAEITVLDGADLLTSGDVVDFGSAEVDVPVDKVLTVRNDGTRFLTLPLLDPGALPAGFQLLSNLSNTALAPGQSATFSVRMESSTTGAFGGPLSLVSNDSDENPFVLNLSGQVITIPQVQVVDDGEGGFSTSGSWRVATDQGHEGDVTFAEAGSGSNVASWTFPVVPGLYRVSATWSEHPNRATDAPFTILDGASELATVDVNQEQAPSGFEAFGSFWNDLGGTHPITSSTLTVRLSNDANEFVIADAIRVERIPDGPEITVLDGTTSVASGAAVDLGSTVAGVPLAKEITVRNDGTTDLTLMAIDPGTLPAGFQLLANLADLELAPSESTTFSVGFVSSTPGSLGGAISLLSNDGDENPFSLGLHAQVISVPAVQIVNDDAAAFTAVGAWDVATNQGHESDVHYTAAGAGMETATWNFTVEPGLYRVSATWSEHPNRATDAPFTILDGASEIVTVDVNQEQAPSDFSDQGSSWFDVAGGIPVTSSSLSVRLSNDANEFVIADAVRVERISTAPEITVLDGAEDLANGATVDLGSTVVGVPLDKELTVRNDGLTELTLGSLDPNAFPAGIRLLSNLSATTLTPGASATFSVRLEGEAEGTFGGAIALTSNDSDENPFVLDLTGRVITVSESQIIDDGEPGFGIVGTWGEATDQGREDDVRFAEAGAGNDVATWTFTVTPGTYRVSATWTEHPNRATDAPFTIFDGGTQRAQVEVNQEQAPADFTVQDSAWHDLATVVHIASSTLSVQLTNDANEFVLADAIRVERVRDVTETVLAGAINFLRTNLAPNGLPFNEATRAELDAGSQPSSAHFVPAQPGAVLPALVMSNALRKDAAIDFPEGYTDEELIGQLELTVDSLATILSTSAYVGTGGGKALYQVHDTLTGAARTGAFEETVSLLDNTQLMVGLELTRNYVDILRFSLPTPLATRAQGVVADLDALLGQFDVGLWFQDNVLTLGGEQNPLAGPTVDRIVTEGRLAPVVGLARGELSEAEFDLLVDPLLANSVAGTTPTGSPIKYLPFFGSALEAWAVTPYLTSELTTPLGQASLLPLATAWAEGNALRSEPLPGFGATGVADGFGGFAEFTASPAEFDYASAPSVYHDADVIVAPAAGLLAGATGTEEAVANLAAVVGSLAQDGLWHATYGMPNYQGFGADAALVNGVNPVWGTLEIAQMTVALSNHLLGGQFAETLLRQSPMWDAALDRYTDRLDAAVVREGESAADAVPMQRSNAAGTFTTYLEDVGDTVTFTVNVPTTRAYTLATRYSNDDAGPGDTIALRVNGVLVQNLLTDDTGDWNAFVTSPEVSLGVLPAGDVDLTFALSASDGFGWELDYFRLL